jgi:hypothetical protein
MLKFMFGFMEITHELFALTQMKFSTVKDHRHTYKFYLKYYII